MSSMSKVSSAETVANIEELHNQILISLPALSLIRFKTISKHWLSLISDPEFHRRHTLRNPNPKVSAFFSPDIKEKLFKSIPVSCPSGNPFKTLVSSVPDNSSVRILQSCNGLFLCHIRNIIDDETDILEHLQLLRVVYVVNPTTNKFLALSAPSLEKNQDQYKFVRYALAFDPTKSPYYKVICVTNIHDHSDYYPGYHQIDIYSSETSAWVKHLEIPFFPSPSDVGRHHDFFDRAMHFDYRSNGSAVYCNGAIHWIRSTYKAHLSMACSRDGWRGWVRQECDVLHYFDINEECLRLAVVTPPVPLCAKNIPMKQNGHPTVWPQLVHRCCGDSSDRLYLIETYKYKNSSTQVLDVMEMERDYSGWTVKYHVDIASVDGLVPTLLRHDSEDMNAFVVLGLFQDNERDDATSATDLWLHVPGKVVSYNRRSNTFKTIAELVDKEHFLSLDDGSWIDHDTYAYLGSLASVV